MLLEERPAGRFPPALAAYLAGLHDHGRTASSAAMAVARRHGRRDQLRRQNANTGFKRSAAPRRELTS